MNMGESPTQCRTGFTIPGDSQPCRCSRTYTNSSMPNSAKPTSIHYGGKIVCSNVLGARATTLAAGARTNTDPGANATGAIAASAPSTTSPIPCDTRASGRWGTGFSRPSCCACRVHLVASPENWASISAPAIAGAGGCAMRLSPTRRIAT
jgi:hypothetical protein